MDSLFILVCILLSHVITRLLVYLYLIFLSNCYLDTGERLFLFILQIKIFVAERNDVTTYVTSHIHNC